MLKMRARQHAHAVAYRWLEEQLRTDRLKAQLDDKGLAESDQKLVRAALDNLVQRHFERGDYGRA